jgi:O-antigen ligase
MIITSILSTTNFSTLLYGVVGRNTGNLTYVALSIIGIASFIHSNYDFVKKLEITLILTGAINCVYGLFQYLGIDFAQWANPFSPIVTTLGNPNFASAHLAITAIACLPFILFNKTRNSLKLLLIVQSLLSLFLMYESDSAQGYLIYLILAPIILFLCFKKQRPHFFTLIFWFLYSASLCLGALGIFGRGPLSNLLFQNSFLHRIDMWKIALRIFHDFPLSGVGMDSYSFWYRTYRDTNQETKWGSGTVSDASHNLILDFATSGGLFLAGLSLIMVCMVTISAFKILRDSKNYDRVHLSLIFSGIAFLLQSLVSINQIALSVWGYLISGSIISLSKPKNDSADLQASKFVSRKIQRKLLILPFISTLLFANFVVSPPYVKDLKFRKAIDNQSAVSLFNSVNDFPYTDEYYRVGATLLLQSNLLDLSADLARKGVQAFPRSVELYELLIANDTVSEVDKVFFQDSIEKIENN